jgi:hypothetical protein
MACCVYNIQYVLLVFHPLTPSSTGGNRTKQPDIL